MADSDAAFFNNRRLVVMGSRAVGKSSLIVRFAEQKPFNDLYYPTIEHTYQKSITHNGAQYKCDIVDTAGQDEFSLIGTRLSVGVDAFILVYSVTDRQSFDLIRTMYDKVLVQIGLRRVPCVLVGQKTDLEEDREVTAAEGKQLGDLMGVPFLETSAKENSNIDTVFEFALAEVDKTRPSRNSSFGQNSNGSSTEKDEKASSCVVM